MASKKISKATTMALVATGLLTNQEVFLNKVLVNGASTDQVQSQ